MSASDPNAEAQSRLDAITQQLEEAAATLRGDDLDPAAAAALIESCASLAGEASGELDRLVREAGSDAGP